MIIRERDLDLKTSVLINNQVYILSTVALCVEHYGGTWYESMVFKCVKNEVQYDSLYCERYKDKETAVKRHKELEEQLLDGKKFW